jgi:hypothetical protein|tara:strand:+ start:362 stop:529 length:168 start_codon:yes stop_codon:yes gene_type:complete
VIDDVAHPVSKHAAAKSGIGVKKLFDEILRNRREATREHQPIFAVHNVAEDLLNK